MSKSNYILILNPQIILREQYVYTIKKINTTCCTIIQYVHVLSDHTYLSWPSVNHAMSHVTRKSVCEGFRPG